MLAKVIQLNLEFDNLSPQAATWSAGGRNKGSPFTVTHLLAPILQVAHQTAFRAFEVGQLECDRLACALKVSGALGQVFASLDSRRRDGKGALSHMQARYQPVAPDLTSVTSIADLQLLVDGLEVLDCRHLALKLLRPKFELVLEIRDFI